MRVHNFGMTATRGAVVLVRERIVLVLILHTAYELAITYNMNNTTNSKYN